MKSFMGLLVMMVIVSGAYGQDEKKATTRAERIRAELTKLRDEITELKNELLTVKELIEKLRAENLDLKQKLLIERVSENKMTTKPPPRTVEASESKVSGVTLIPPKINPLKIIEIRYPLKDKIETYTGPGTEYGLDETGPTYEAETLHVVEEKNGWVRFRVTTADFGWHGWVPKNQTIGQLEKIETEIAQRISKGVIHSVNVDLNEVRIPPEVWAMWSIESKQGLVTYFSNYFDAKGSTGRVTVLSNRNDKKLATYSVWTGVKILE